MWSNVQLWPEQGSAMAGRVDLLFLFLIAVSLFFAILIATLVLVFAIRYRRERHPKAEQIEGSLPLELAWTLIPLGLSLVMFVWGAYVYFGLTRAPQSALEIWGTGKQWMWKFQHLTGQREINQLHVPVNRDIKMTLISNDVIHSFYVPAFRVKMDVLPNRYTTIWFRPIKPGTYHLFCAEYCGTQHSGMIGQVIVMEPAEYQAWLAGGAATGSLASNGQKLFEDLACITCHRTDSQGRGPNLEGVFGKPVNLEDGRTLVADENYVRESILNPQAKVVRGFQPIMPTFQGQISEDGLLALVEYVKSLGAPKPGQQGPNSAPPAPNAAQPEPVNRARERK